MGLTAREARERSPTSCWLPWRSETSPGLAAAVSTGASAVLLYHDGTPDLYSGVMRGGAAPIPCVTLRRADALWLAVEGRPVQLEVHCCPTDVIGENLPVQAGTGGRPLLFVANYDSRSGTPGAYRNASGVAALLGLLGRYQTRGGRGVLLAFVDGDDPSVMGSRHLRDVLQALGRLSQIRGVIYVSGVGLHKLAVAAGPTAKSAALSAVARELVATEGLQPEGERASPDGTVIPPGVWRRPTVALTGPALPVQHTAMDRPDLLNPRYLCRSVSALDRLAQASWQPRVPG